MSPARRELAIDLVVLASAIVINLAVAPGAHWPFRLLALFGLVVSVGLIVRDLHRLNEQRYGTFDLTVACDHSPEGVQLDGLSRSALWLALRQLDPAHHRVTINRVPLDADRWRELKRGRS